MTTRDIRIKIMKNHIYLISLANNMGVAPVVLDKWLSDENLDDEIKSSINETIDKMLKTWKVGKYLESTDMGKLVKPYMIKKYKQQKERENN